MKNKLEKLDEKLLANMSFTSQGSLVGLTAYIGGVFSQEVHFKKKKKNCYTINNFNSESL